MLFVRENVGMVFTSSGGERYAHFSCYISKLKAFYKRVIGSVRSDVGVALQILFVQHYSSKFRLCWMFIFLACRLRLLALLVPMKIIIQSFTWKDMTILVLVTNKFHYSTWHRKFGLHTNFVTKTKILVLVIYY